MNLNRAAIRRAVKADKGERKYKHTHTSTEARRAKRRKGLRTRRVSTGGRSR